MEQQSAVRIVVCDSQPVFRYGLKQFLDTTTHLRVVGEVSDPLQAAEAVRQLSAQVLVVTAPGSAAATPGLNALAELSRQVRCIVVTDGTRFIPPTQLAVAGMLSRESPTGAFLDCIDCVLRSQCWPDDEPCRPTVAATAPAPKYKLTRREAQIVSAVADGASNKDIAVQLSISEDTVKHHMSNIFDKVGVHSRLELAVFALYHGVVTMYGA